MVPPLLRHAANTEAEGSGDRGDPENKDFGQTQAFGLADLGMDFPEMGYINIEEITRLGAELDYHFTPTTLLEVKKEHYPELVQDTAPALDADLVAHLEIRNRIRQGELGASGMPSIGGVDSLPGGGLPTGLGGDPIANAEKFLRNHAMRNPEQAAQWVAALRGNPEEYAQASGLEGVDTPEARWVAQSLGVDRNVLAPIEPRLPAYRAPQKAEQEQSQEMVR